MNLVIIKNVDPSIVEPIEIREEVVEILLETDAPLKFSKRADGRVYITEIHEKEE